MLYRSIIFALVLILGVTQTTFAESYPSPVISAVSSFREYTQVSVPSILVPTVVEMPVTVPNNSRKDFIVVDRNVEILIPIQSYLKEVYTITPATFTAYSSNGIGAANNLLDQDFSSAVYYSLNEGGEMTAEITLTTFAPVKVSGFDLALEKNVSLPATVEVSAVVNRSSMVSEIVLAKSRMTSDRVNFIPTVASTFIIRFTYVQPLQINELSLIQTDVEKNLSQSLRFLAQPDAVYMVYQNPDTAVNLPLRSYVDLISDKDVLQIAQPQFRPNPKYIQADGDRDGVPDVRDNCVSVANSDQVDIDNNGRGDACDDWDKDGVMNPIDNCQNIPNANQADEDSDGIGDACDEEESRFTERNKWVPWAGMGIAVFVLIGMFALVAKRPLLMSVAKPEDDSEIE